MHRDIKPANALIRYSPSHKGAGPKIESLVLTDLGFACRAGSDHGCPGTPRYMSPELVREQPYGLPADVWAAGVSLMELWTRAEPMAEAQDDYECEDRIDAEFRPPEMLGPVWHDSEALLAGKPVLWDALRRCFLPQKERGGAAALQVALGPDTSACLNSKRRVHRNC